jgi:FAD/FMN-containing dehydrogenase
MTHAAPDWGALQSAIAGNVVLPGSSDYESVRKPAIFLFQDVRPKAVVLCRTPTDVSETISFAIRYRLPTATRSGEHCFAGHPSTHGIVIDVSPMRSVSVSGGVATVGAGARLGDVYDSLDEHGLTIPAGCGPSVGIAGLTLGGGLGILGRKYGLTSDQLLTAQVVLADGRVVECDEHQDGELFWALRGAGGGNFGVVTSLTFNTIPSPDCTAFHLLWPHSGAAALIDAWQSWAPAAPDELAASLLMVASGDVDQPPLVNLFGAMIGTESDTEELLNVLVARVGTDPISASQADVLPGYKAVSGRTGRRDDRRRRSVRGDLAGRVFGAGTPLQQVRVLWAAAANRGHRGAGRKPPEGESCGPGARARFHAVGRRVQPRAQRRYGLRPSW